MTREFLSMAVLVHCHFFFLTIYVYNLSVNLYSLCQTCTSIYIKKDEFLRFQTLDFERLIFAIGRSGSIHIWSFVQIPMNGTIAICWCDQHTHRKKHCNTTSTVAVELHAQKAVSNYEEAVGRYCMQCLNFLWSGGAGMQQANAVCSQPATAGKSLIKQ